MLIFSCSLLWRCWWEGGLAWDKPFYSLGRVRTVCHPSRHIWSFMGTKFNSRFQHLNVCTIIPCWWVPPVLKHWGLRLYSLSVIIITDRPSYAVVDCRRPSFSGRCCSCLERTTTSRHVCTISASFFCNSHYLVTIQLVECDCERSQLCWNTDMQ